MSEQTVYDYVKNTSKTIDNKDFEMLHQYALDKIRSCDFGPDYKYTYCDHNIHLESSRCGTSIDTKCKIGTTDKRDYKLYQVCNYESTQLFEKIHLPLFDYEYIYEHRTYPKIIHSYLHERNIMNYPCAYVCFPEYGSGNSIVPVEDTQCDENQEGYHTKYKYLEYYAYHRSPAPGNYELYDIYPKYIEPKHSKQDYINYFITNDFNCNSLRKLILELSKIMLTRREECITKHVKQDVILDDLQLLINYAQQMIIDCKEYLDKQMNDATVKLSF